MKQLIKTIGAKVLLTMLAWYSGMLYVAAQNSSATTTTRTETQTIDVQPWVWVVGGAVFILILVALLRSNKTRDSVTITKTTNNDI